MIYIKRLLIINMKALKNQILENKALKNFIDTCKLIDVTVKDNLKDKS